MNDQVKEGRMVFASSPSDVDERGWIEVRQIEHDLRIVLQERVGRAVRRMTIDEARAFRNALSRMIRRAEKDAEPGQ